ncbi:MAG: addiction module protein [Candidatus Omnitrophica bacterium]|nr:addiction module protein [Candidatus Omnitrophota bacterium]MCA9416295.1 addiction module protein [Candidatus Omnitrophota bacterium]MCA9427493.1 addiction module protein [Candidatus Omnitrophota bacterium]MCA9429365.1 addiction module protein [Candidatus Omnitrophota bacterium]MCA9437727.1 addiction module protein [Candidatus Omnitrophota bacterium]
MNANDLLSEAIALPIEERAVLIDRLMRSLNPTEPELDRKWIEVAKKRREEIESGEVKPVPGEEVFKRVWDRFAKPE